MHVHNGAATVAPMASTADGEISPEVRELSAALLPDAPAIGAEVAARVIAEVPFFGSQAVLTVDDVVEACQAHIRNILEMLAGVPASRPELARVYAEGRAELGVPYDALLEAFRVGGRHVWDVMVSRAPVESRDALLRGAADVWLVTDRIAGDVTDGYRRAISSRARRDGERRSIVVGAVLAGEIGQGEDMWNAAGVLGMDRSSDFLVVAAECPATGVAAVPDVERVLLRDNLVSAWRFDHDRHEGLVQLRAGNSVERLVERLTDAATTRIGVSSPFSRLIDAAEALRQARTACAAGTPGSSAVVRYDEVPLPILIASAPAQARSLATSVLGGVLDLPPEDRAMLVETARTWFEAAGSSSAAARALHLHRNTVRYRLRRLEQLTGRDLSRPIDQTDVYVALECARILALA